MTISRWVIQISYINMVVALPQWLIYRKLQHISFSFITLEASYDMLRRYPFLRWYICKRSRELWKWECKTTKHYWDWLLFTIPGAIMYHTWLSYRDFEVCRICRIEFWAFCTVANRVLIFVHTVLESWRSDNKICQGWQQWLSGNQRETITRAPCFGLPFAVIHLSELSLYHNRDIKDNCTPVPSFRKMRTTVERKHTCIGGLKCWNI